MRYGSSAALLVGLSLLPSTGWSVEGGIETYLLGSRDSGAGILPPPGTYINNDFVYFEGSTGSISAAGAALVDPEIKVFTYKLSATHVFDATLWGARVGVNINVPYVSARMTYQAQLSSGLTGELDDAQTGLADITVSPLFGWSRGNLHTLLALQFFLPTGAYEKAKVSVSGRSLDALNTGKNRFAFDPTLSMTWLNPDTGLELTGAFGVTFSAENEATNYQTAPEAHFEGTVMQHFPSKVAIGATGYAYQQLDDDSGAGAEQYRAVTGASSLQARVYGVGPIATWQTTLGSMPISLKAKYIREFDAKRRFESDKAWLTVGLVF